MIVQGEGSSSHDQPVAIDDELLRVVVESPLPPPQSQPDILAYFLRDIMYEGGESGEPSGESSNNTMPEHKHKIQKIPQMLWRKKETNKYYQPHLVSIGPYYHKYPDLKSFEKVKMKFTREYVKSCEPPSINELYNKAAEVAGEARSCYAEGTTEGIDNTTFTKMMFLDGCFILQFIWCIVKNEKAQLEKLKSHDIALVKRDLFLLGNQLPLIVLEKLITATKSTLFAGRKGSYSIPKFITKIRETHHSPLPERKHYNHLLQYMWEDHIDYDDTISSRNWEKQDSGSNRHTYLRHSAMDLKMVGIRFRPSYRAHLSYIAFKPTWTGGMLILPKINIDDATISLLHNLIAYEHCPDTCASYLWVTNYICFLDSIIDSANDVKELKYAGIISNFLGNDEEVVKVIHGMAAGLVPDCRNTRYSEIKLRIKEYHSHKGKTRIASWISEVIRDHFRSPWTVIAVFAALFALCLTAVQTYFGVFPNTLISAKNPS